MPALLLTIALLALAAPTAGEVARAAPVRGAVVRGVALAAPVRGEVAHGVALAAPARGEVARGVALAAPVRGEVVRGVALAAPVPGRVVRPFSYGPNPFRAGWHRGVDLVAAPGVAVRAACSGVVATARPGLVTLRCGRWRVTHLPVASVSARVGDRVGAGAAVGKLGTVAGHTGLHLGVRRAGDRFGYVDPIPLLGARTTSPPPVPAPRTRVPRSGPGGSRPSRPPMVVPATPPTVVTASPRDAAFARLGPAPSSLPATAASAPASGRVRVSAPAAARALAPWPAWIGLVLLALGAVGGGVRFKARRGRAAGAVALGSAR